MTEFRTTEQIQADFIRLDPRFKPVADIGTLIGLLTDDRLGDAAVYAAGGGPVLYDLGILNGPEWEGVRQFLNSRLVTPEFRTEFQQFEKDLQAADTNRDGFVNNPEMVAYAQAHTDRWPNVATFRNAADVFLNRLPGYFSQTNLNDRDVARLWGVMNHLARENDRLGVEADKRGTVYGLSLGGFPSEDRNNPPNLIRRALDGTLSPQELAAVHHILKTRLGSDRRYSFADTAPFSPMEIGVLGTILDAAAERDHAFLGMTLLNGDEEISFLASRNQAAEACQKGIETSSSDPNALPQAFQDCSTSMASVEADHPERIGVKNLLIRAYTGDLSPSEIRALRDWMKKEAADLGLICEGTWGCMGQGAKQVFQNIAQDPWHFIARNGAFIGGALLYRRLVLRNAIQSRLEKACGGPVANPRQAHRAYEDFLAGEMKKAALWKRFFNQLVKNPRHGWLGKVFIGFPVTFLHLAAFNAIANRKDVNNLVIDIPTDLLLIPFLFEAWETYDAFKNPSLEAFAAANPGLCAESPAPAKVQAPQPEAAQSALLNESIEGVISGEAVAGEGHDTAVTPLPDFGDDWEDEVTTEWIPLPEGVITTDEGALIYAPEYQATVDGRLIAFWPGSGLESLAGRDYTYSQFLKAVGGLRGPVLKGPSRIEVPSVSAVSTEAEATAWAAARARSSDAGRVNGVIGAGPSGQGVRSPVLQPRLGYRVAVP